MTSLSAGLVLGKVWIIVSIQLWLINFRKLVQGLELIQKIAAQLLVILIVLSFHQWKLLSSEKHKAKERHRCTWVQLLSPTLPWGKKGKNIILCPQGSGVVLCIQQKSKEIVCNKKIQIRYEDFPLIRIVMLEIS